MTSHSNRPNGPAIRRYTELIVWQKAMTLVEVVYQASAQLPDRERFGITQQIRCAAVSVPCNIAEGYGRMNNGDYARFLAIARGSLLRRRHCCSSLSTWPISDLGRSPAQ